MQNQRYFFVSGIGKCNGVDATFGFTFQTKGNFFPKNEFDKLIFDSHKIINPVITFYQEMTISDYLDYVGK